MTSYRSQPKPLCSLHRLRCVPVLCRPGTIDMTRIKISHPFEYRSPQHTLRRSRAFAYVSSSLLVVAKLDSVNESPRRHACVQPSSTVPGHQSVNVRGASEIDQNDRRNIVTSRMGMTIFRHGHVAFVFPETRSKQPGRVTRGRDARYARTSSPLSISW